MEIRQEGDSSSVSAAFGFGDDIAGGTIQTPERETISDVTEGSTDSVEIKDEAVDTVTHEEMSTPELSDEDKRVVIDTIERQLDQFDQGILSAEDLQKFFSDKPEVANIANKAKRVKERYRAFNEGEHPRLKMDEPVKPEVKEEVSIDKPLTLKDLDAYFSQKEGYIYEKQLQAEKEKKFVSFAIDKGIVDDEAESLKKTAVALSSINPDWTYEQALEAAHRAIQPAGKPKPIQVVNGGGLRENVSAIDEEKVDLSQGTWSIDAKSFGLS